MLRKILWVILCCCPAILGYGQAAQDEGNLQELAKIPSPPSPNAAALGKFGEIPVGLATGIPTIAVPLFSWKDELKEPSFDISLNYHAGGHKVEDMASNVGLGWALNAGGLISRTVRGIPDDGFGGYLNTGSLPSHYISHTEHLSDVPSSQLNGLTWDNNQSSFIKARDIANRLLDGEYDIWNLNAGSLSARFFLDKNGAVNFFTQSNLSVTYTRTGVGGSPIMSFTVVDDRAITYLFDVLEGTESVPEEIIPGSVSNACTSGYYLSKIISADKKDTIFLSYNTGNDIYYEGGWSDSYRATFRSGNLTFLPIEINQTHSTMHTYGPKKISLIKFPDSTQVSFAYDFARDDYDGDNALTSVTISNGSQSKKFDLSYNYFSTVSDASAIAMPFSPNDFSKRLKLLQVQEISGSDSLPPYVFQYVSQNLPPRNSKNQDHWGYFRGAGSSPASLAAFISPPTGINRPPQLGSANREPVEEYTKASVLEQITYPTGGFTKFTYHINEAHTPYYNSANIFDSITLNEAQEGSFVSLTMGNREATSVLFQVRLYNYLPPPEMEPWDENCPVVITVKSTDNTVTETINTSYGVALNGVQSILTLPLDKTYQVKYQTDCPWLEDFSVTVQFQYSIPPTAKNVGGLRVEATEDDDGMGNKMKTNYSYLTYDNNSSGHIQNLPNYSFYTSTTRKDPAIGSIEVYIDYHWNIASTTNQSLSYFRGSPIIYTRVKVNKSTPSTNVGYSVHEFTEFSSSNILADGTYPFIQPQDFEWAQALPLRDSIFNSNDQLVKLVRKDWHAYLLGGDSAKWRNMISSMIFNDVFQTATMYSYAAKSYWLAFGRAELLKNTEVLYADGDSIKTVTEYTYDSNKFLLTKQKTFSSIGEEIETRLYYPFNYSIDTDEKLSSVIAKESYTKKGGTWYLTSGTTNEFDTFNSSFIKQKKIITTELASTISESTVGAFNPALLVRHASFKEQVEFLSYDSRGRYTELKTMSKPITSLFWCSTKNYPMAVVENASHVNCAFSSFETADLGNWSGIVLSNIQTGVAATGDRFYQQTGFSISKSGLSNTNYYTISYWSKNGAYSISGTQPGYPKTGRTVGAWTLYEHLVTGQTTITMTGTGSIDELRLYPRGSLMTTYTFKPLAGISSQCDVNNRINYYEYDGFGRLKLIRDQDKNILKTIDYKFQVNTNQ